MGAKFCQECGTKLTEGAKFCPECGTKIILQSNQVEAEEELKLAIKLCDDKKYDKAVPVFKKYAEIGNRVAQFYLGVCYGSGYGVIEDNEKWLYWIQKSAEQGYTNAQYQLGEYCENELNDCNKAMYWYQKAADQGDEIAKISIKLLKGEKPKVEAKKMPEEEELKWAFRYCDSSCEDYKEAFDIITKYAENGNAEAQYTLGLCYANGDVVPQDYKKAYYWYQKAADQGHKDAEWEIENWDFE